MTHPATSIGIETTQPTNPIRLLSETLTGSLESHSDTQGSWWVLSINLTDTALPLSGRGVEASEDAIKLRVAGSLLCLRDQSLAGPSCRPGWHLCASLHRCVLRDCDELTALTTTVSTVTSGARYRCFAWSLLSLPPFPMLPPRISHSFRTRSLMHRFCLPLHPPFTLIPLIPSLSVIVTSVPAPTEALSSLKAGRLGEPSSLPLPWDFYWTFACSRTWLSLVSSLMCGPASVDWGATVGRVFKYKVHLRQSVILQVPMGDSCSHTSSCCPRKSVDRTYPLCFLWWDRCVATEASLLLLQGGEMEISKLCGEQGGTFDLQEVNWVTLLQGPWGCLLCVYSKGHPRLQNCLHVS